MSKNCFMRASFVIVGLIIIGSAFFWGRLENVQAAVSNGQKFDDWVATCVKDERGKQLCFLSQQILSKPQDEQGADNQEKKIEVLAIYQLGYFGAEKKLRMLQTLPLGVKLQPGTSIISDKKLIAPATYNICSSIGCQAIAELSDQDLETILSASENLIAFMNAEGKQITLPISGKGLKAGLAALK